MPDLMSPQITERAFWLPFGIDAGGQKRWVVPGFLHDMGTALDNVTSGRGAFWDAGDNAASGDWRGAGHAAGDVALNVGLAGSVVPKPANAVGIFGGRLAAERLAAQGETRPLQMLTKMEELEKAGVPREKIWEETAKIGEGSPYIGSHRGVDKQPRFEIDDSKATLPYSQPGMVYDGPVKALLDHPDLMKAYPEKGAAKGKLTFDQRLPEGTGVAYANGAVIVSAPTVQSARTTFLHEMQHQVQHADGLESGAGGGWIRTPEDLLRHNRNAGENEAYTVEARANLTPEQRRARPPWLDYVIPEHEQTLRRDLMSR